MSTTTQESFVPLYEEMTSPDIADAVEQGAHVIIPFGSMEQHGGHLPLGTDTYQAVDVARRSCRQLVSGGIPAIVGPNVAYGPRQFMSDSPFSPAGSINISHDTLKSLAIDICSELVRHGFRHLYLLCGHCESDPVLQIVAKEVSETTEASAVSLLWLLGVMPEYEGVLLSDTPQGHGGEEETAHMLAIAPHLVRMDKAKATHPAPIPGKPPCNDRMPFLGGAIGRYKLPQHLFAGCEESINGDPQNATAETGERSLKIVTDWVCAAVRREWSIWN